MEMNFGAMAPSIAEQLTEQKLLCNTDIEHWQRDADAITRLAVRGMLPLAQARAARQRLLREIARHVKPNVGDQRRR
jgi:hypothetical protein